MGLFQRVSGFGVGVLIAVSAYAEGDVNPAEVIKQRLAEAVPGLRILKVSPSPIQGVYEVESNNPQLIYISADGKYFVAGDIYQVDDGRITNLAEERREQTRAEMINAVGENQMVVFKPANGEPSAKVTVFTDVDCGYCRKLHKEVPRLNELGVQVNYMAFPRAGVGSGSYDKMVSIWCAEDQQDAMTTAKLGRVPTPKTCDNPVADQYELGNQIGITELRRLCLRMVASSPDMCRQILWPKGWVLPPNRQTLEFNLSCQAPPG